ncbi:VCBS domain-containing protein, partial [Mesorhizobium sp. ArgA1]
MATQIAGAGGTTTSFSNTPQAKDDVFNYTEDNVVIVSASQSIILLDVMANDLGGNAKTLYSVDDGTSDSTSTKQYAPIDLTTQDVQATGISAWECIGGGVYIRINNGKVEMDLSQYLQQHGFASLQALTATDRINETFTYAIKLGNGTLSWASVSVNIQGTNDGATITAAANVDNTVVEAGGVANGTPGDASAHGQLTVSDVDANQNNFQAPPSLQGTYGTFTFDTTTGAWIYALNQALADPLKQGQQVTDTLQVKSADGTATYNIVVNITGSNDVPVINGVHTGLVTEDVAVVANKLSASGALTINDADQGQSNFAPQASVAGSNGYGTFTLDAAGNWTYSASNTQAAIQHLAAGQSVTDSFTAVSSDGTAGQLVTVTIYGTNDKPTITVAGTDADGAVIEDSASPILSDTGTIAFSDLDLIDVHTTSVTAAAANTLEGTLIMGAASENALTEPGTVGWTYQVANAATQYLAQGQTATEKFTVTIDDGHGGTVSQLVTVTITGTNDAPNITVGAGDNAATGINEANLPLSTSGTLTVTDADLSDTVSASVTSVSLGGTLGGLNSAAVINMLTVSPASLTADSGETHNLTWSFNSSPQAFDFLAAGETLTLTYTIKADDGHVGGTDTQTVTITIVGTNDAPLITSDPQSGSVSEGDDLPTSAQQASGQVTFSDVDASDSHSFS